MKPTALHPWVRPISIAYLPAAPTPAVSQATDALLAWLRAAGSVVTSTPDAATDLIITTARLGTLVSRDEALLFHAKRKFRLPRRPKILTVVDVPEAEYHAWLASFSELAGQPADAPLTQQYAGLGPQAVEVIAHQARRGGPVLAFSRLVQAQVLSIRVLALRTLDGRPYRAMHFDLAGARPVTDATDLDDFAADAGARILAAMCTDEVNHHTFLDDPVPADKWSRLRSPDLMIRAGSTFTEFGFFTTPIQVEKMLGYRGIGDAISAQYSEGCYAAFDPDLPGLVTTATGSSRLVDKRSITRMDQAVVTGVRPSRDGAIVRPVAGMETVVPSVEAVEMMGICEAVSRHRRRNADGEAVEVPNISALLHGHLGIEAFDPDRVEAVSLEPLFYTQLVSCGTGALAAGTAAAFARSAALRDLEDPRRIVVLEQPGHGVMIAEKWPGPDGPHEPFATIHEYLRAGHLRMTLDIPQGPVAWEERVSLDGRRLRFKAAEGERELLVLGR
jgi:hypothetical protein